LKKFGLVFGVGSTSDTSETFSAIKLFLIPGFCLTTFTGTGLDSATVSIWM